MRSMVKLMVNVGVIPKLEIEVKVHHEQDPSIKEKKAKLSTWASEVEK